MEVNIMAIIKIMKNIKKHGQVDDHELYRVENPDISYEMPNGDFFSFTRWSEGGFKYRLKYNGSFHEFFAWNWILK